MILVVLVLVLVTVMGVREGAPQAVYLAYLPIIAILGGYLRIRDDDEGLVLTFAPVWRRRIPWEDIRSMQVDTYHGRRFGGWGLRLGRGAVAYSVWGLTAVRVKVRGRRDVVFTTADPEGWVEVWKQRRLVAG